MGANPYIHIPSESWPHFTWYAIEFGIVTILGMLASSQITNSIEGLALDVQNYVWMGIFGILFFIWYMLLRPVILKQKRILNNKY